MPLANPDHEVIKANAAAMLDQLTETPEGLQKLDPGLLPIAEFVNGIRRPNQKPPTTVYVVLDGQRWVKQRGKKWSRA